MYNAWNERAKIRGRVADGQMKICCGGNNAVGNLNIFLATAAAGGRGARGRIKVEIMLR